MSYQRLAQAVLVDLRDVEHHLGLLGATTPEAAYLATEAETLRDEYQQLIDAARRHGKPVPPPFPTWAVPDSADRRHRPDSASLSATAPEDWRPQRL